MSSPDRNWTVGELIEQLKQFDPNVEVEVGPHFSIYRVKDRSGICQIEINEVDGVEYQWNGIEQE